MILANLPYCKAVVFRPIRRWKNEILAAGKSLGATLGPIVSPDAHSNWAQVPDASALHFQLPSDRLLFLPRLPQGLCVL